MESGLIELLAHRRLLEIPALESWKIYKISRECKSKITLWYLFIARTGAWVQLYKYSFKSSKAKGKMKSLKVAPEGKLKHL